MTDEIYQYDTLGNIVSKTGVGAYSYSAAHPHAVTTAGAFGFGYDANGNMTTAGGQITTWDAENRPTSIARVSGTETYAYDADGERIVRTAGFTTTVFLGGMWQEDVAGGAVGVTRVLYGFNGASVAQRTHVTTPASDSVVYLHGDYLGSVSVVSGSNGSAVTLLGSQRFDPWGKVIAGGTVTQTRTNYTGQELDTTQLLYYHARYYDPNLGRFLSADTVVPGSASGSMDGVQLRPLTVDFHEPGFVGQIGGENGQAFWFQLSDEQREKVGSPWGPASPQALNRYSYVQNNPLGATDPSGHTPKCYEPGCGSEVVNNSDESVEVQGNRYIQGCDVASHGTDCWEYVQVRLDPGESSADYGITDVDRVRAMSTNTIGGHGRDDVFEVSDGMQVTIISSSPGKLSIEAVVCFGSYGWRCEAGMTIGGASMLLIPSRYHWKQLPGWYAGEDAKRKWWKDGKVAILPSKRDGIYRGNE